MAARGADSKDGKTTAGRDGKAARGTDSKDGKAARGADSTAARGVDSRDGKAAEAAPEKTHVAAAVSFADEVAAEVPEVPEVAEEQVNFRPKVVYKDRKWRKDRTSQREKGWANKVLAVYFILRPAIAFIFFGVASIVLQLVWFFYSVAAPLKVGVMGFWIGGTYLATGFVALFAVTTSKRPLLVVASVLSATTFLMAGAMTGLSVWTLLTPTSRVDYIICVLYNITGVICFILALVMFIYSLLILLQPWKAWNPIKMNRLSY